MVETELKFQIPPGVRRLVRRAVATQRARMTPLQAMYVDTADRRLAGAGLALRLRLEGRHWVQTLKGRGDGVAARLEHEVQLGTTPPALHAQRHAATPVGQRLLQLVADGTPLVVVYRTAIRRTHRVLRVGAARIELAHDRGFIEAAGRRLAVEELEFELKAGTPQDLAAVAARWVARYGLWWDVRTKSERGHRLAAGLEAVPAVRDAVPLVRALANAAELAEGLGSEAHAAAWREALGALGLAHLDSRDAAGAARSRAHTLALLRTALG